jgi:biopolymer transport protein ExbD
MSRRRQRTEDASVNLTPMIDVVFLLVIFFMVGSHFGEAQGRIDVNVPGVGDLRAMTRQPDERMVEVSGEGRVTLDNRPVSLDELSRQLRAMHQQYPDVRVSIRGEAEASFQRVAEVLQVIRSTGIQQMGIAAKGMRR